MSNQATFDQAFQMLNLGRESGASLERLQSLYATGLLSDLLKTEDPTKVNRDEFRRILGFDPSVFCTAMGGPETTDDIVRYLRANGFASVDDYITQANFPLQPQPEMENDEIEIVDPGTSFNEGEGLAVLKEKGLDRPTYEHALRFAEQHGKTTTSEKKPYVIFLHEAWRDPYGSRRVLYVYRHPDNRGFSLHYPGRRFYGDCVLAGVRPRK